MDVLSTTSDLASKTMVKTFAGPSIIENGRLAGLMGADIASAFISAALISPVIVAIDRSVVENVATSSPILKNLRRHAWNMVTRPRGVLGRPLLVMWTLYAATYSMVNLTDTVATRFLGKTDKAVVGALVSFNAFVINTPLSVWKDVRFAQSFGTTTTSTSQSATKTALQSVVAPAACSSSPPAAPIATATASSSVSSKTLTTHQPVRDSASPSPVAPRDGLSSMAPPKVCAAFLLRDIITVFGTFALAPQVSSLVPNTTWTRNPESKSAASQLIVPAMTQIVATPLHLLALDLNARPQPAATAAVKGQRRVGEPSEISLRDRLRVVIEKWPAVTVMRGVRLIPAFGIAVVFNMRTRESLHRFIDDEYEP